MVLFMLCRVSTVLLLLTTRPPAPIQQEHITLPVIIMICREVTMSALREWAAAAGGGAHKVGSNLVCCK
jgi:CDP-diacylglycerol--glycerol-3-phosphate 3-phosphatidyltransferase